MSIQIKLPNETFNFSDLSLGEPSSLSNGFYLSSIKHNGDLYIQTPKIMSKGGFIKSSNKNYIDLIFTSENEIILEWFENLENRVKVLIYENRKNWFAEPNIEMSDIENIFISPIRTYKSGKQFVLRANVDSLKSSFVQVNSVKVYDRNQNEVPMETLDNTSKFITLLHVSGVKFSSRTFQIYVEVKQIMLIDEEPDLFSKCLLGKSSETDLSDEKTESLEVPEQFDNDVESKEEIENVHSQLDTQLDTQSDTQHDQERQPIDNNEVNVQNTVEGVVEDVIQQTESLHKINSNIVDSVEPVHESSTNNEERHLDTSNTEEENQVIQPIDSSNDVVNDDVQESHVKQDGDISEFSLDVDTLESSSIKIYDEDSEHIELYRAAVKKAKDLRKQALQSHLEAQDIKAKYLMNVYSDSESDIEEKVETPNNS